MPPSVSELLRTLFRYTVPAKALGGRFVILPPSTSIVPVNKSVTTPLRPIRPPPPGKLLPASPPIALIVPDPARVGAVMLTEPPDPAPRVAGVPFALTTPLIITIPVDFIMTAPPPGPEALKP